MITGTKVSAERRADLFLPAENKHVGVFLASIQLPGEKGFGVFAVERSFDALSDCYGVLTNDCGQAFTGDYADAKNFGDYVINTFLSNGAIRSKDKVGQLSFLEEYVAKQFVQQRPVCL